MWDSFTFYCIFMPEIDSIFHSIHPGLGVSIHWFDRYNYMCMDCLQYHHWNTPAPWIPGLWVHWGKWSEYNLVYLFWTSCSSPQNLLVLKISWSSLQNLFVLNVLMTDVVVGMVGVVRGIGIIDSRVWGITDGTGEANIFCKVYTLFGTFIW